MARFDLLDEYGSVVSPGRRIGYPAEWPEHFEDSYPRLRREETESRQGTGTLGSLLLLMLAGLKVGLLPKGLL